MFDAIAYLITETEAENDYGDVVTANSERMVYVNEKSIRQSEFYQAAAVGMKPELLLEMRKLDYKGEVKAKYEDRTYNIIRTFAKNRDYIELICQDIAHEEVSDENP